MTAVEELVRIIRLRQQRGMRTAHLSGQNLQVLGRVPPPPVTATPMPAAGQRQAAVDRFRQATAPQVAPQPPYQAQVAPQVAPQQPYQATAPQVAPQPPYQATAPQVAPPQQPYQAQNAPQRQPAPVEPVQPVRLVRPGIPQDGGNFPPPPDVSVASWEQLRECCLHCSSCRLARTRQNVVIEDGCPTSPLMFIGEGPGADEDAQGKPFVGKAGQLLTKMILAMGRDRNSMDPAKGVYIANVVKCRPPQNRNPLPDEAKACIGYLRRQIALVKPKVIVLLGNVALEALYGQGGITRARGVWREFDGIPVMPTFHPAFLLRFEGSPDFVPKKRLVWQDLQQVMARLTQA